MSVDKLYLGMTYHYLTGLIVEAEGKGNIEYNYAEDEGASFSGDGELLIKYTEDNARGFALDYGIFADLNEKTSLGLSIMNNGYMASDTVSYLKYNSDHPEEPEKGTLDESITWNLPTKIKLGGKHQYHKNILLLADYTHTNYDNNLQDSKFSFGSEFTWSKYVPLRLGLNYSTLQNDFDVTTGMGLYMGPVRLDIGISDLLGLFYNSRGIKAGFSTQIAF